jgi:hypothetical protein
MDLLTFTLLLSLAIGHSVFLYNKTDFISEYGGLFCRKWFLCDEYETWKRKEGAAHGYPIFIRERFVGFWSRLQGCPFCLITFISFWPSIVCALGLGSAQPLIIALGAPPIASMWFLLESWFYKNIFE